MRRFLAPRWMARHVALIVLVGAFTALGWWQIGRAEGGNALSYGYAFEWPFFALFVIFVYYREIRGELSGPPSDGEPADLVDPGSRAAMDPATGEPVLRTTLPAPKRSVSDFEQPDREMDEYNEYLAWLNANPDRSPADFRKGRVPGVGIQPRH